MSYSQKNIIELAKSGAIPNEKGKPKHIETVISNIFLFDNLVYKIYKNNSEFFNEGFRDISTKKNRFSFTKKDFNWNHLLSPNIYLRLQGVSVINNEILFVDSTDESEEFMIIMNRVNEEDILFEKLTNNKITKGDCFYIGKQLAIDIKKVRPETLSGYNYFNLFKDRILDLREWMSSADNYINKEEQNKYCDFLESFRLNNEEWFEDELSKEIENAGDIHSHNAVLTNGQFNLMDSFPPKEDWLIEHHSFPLYRIGVDIWALSGNKGFFESFIQGYEEGSNIKLDRRLDNFNILRSAAIMAAYLYLLQETDPDKKEAAGKFHKFLEEYFKTINI